MNSLQTKQLSSLKNSNMGKTLKILLEFSIRKLIEIKADDLNHLTLNLCVKNLGLFQNPQD